MHNLMSHIFVRLSLVLVLALGLAGTGFAHRSAAPVDAQMLAFLQAGGTLADLCDDGSPITHYGSSDCEACRLTAGADAPSVAIGTTHILVAQHVEFVVRPAQFWATHNGSLSHPPRAPPVV